MTFAESFGNILKDLVAPGRHLPDAAGFIGARSAYIIFNDVGLTSLVGKFSLEAHIIYLPISTAQHFVQTVASHFPILRTHTQAIDKSR